MGIEKERAKRRQAEQARQNQPQAKKTNSEKSQNKKPVTDSGKGQSRDAIGEKVGVSGLTAERSAFSVRVMDALDLIGKTVEAHQVRQLLRKNVNKAYWLAIEGNGRTIPHLLERYRR